MVDVCCICLDPLEGDGIKIFKGECSHALHLVCVSGLTSRKCPMCRNKFILPPKIARKVKDNKKQNKEEEEENERLFLASSSLTLLKIFPPFFRVMASDSYLTGLGITKRAHNIKTPISSNPEDQPDIFSAIVMESVEKQRMKLVKSDILKLFDSKHKDLWKTID